MGARGLKRKLHRSDEGRGSVWENQLQSVLDISLDKFQRDQALVEPSLLRSVLINNTLRQVQSEVKTHVENMTGVLAPHTAQVCPQPQPKLRSWREPTPNGFNAGLYKEHNENGEEEFMAWSSEEDFSLSTAISAILKNLDTALDSGCGPFVPQHSPLASVENLTAERKCKQSATIGHKMDICRASDAGSSASVSGYLQDAAIDDILLDFDASVFEEEAQTNAFSLPADELVKYLPSLSTSSSAASSGWLSQGQTARDMHELEHIMDILVQS